MKIDSDELFLKSFIQYLNNNFKYCILRNYEEYPNKIGNDIDILVKEDNIEQLEKRIGDYFNEHNLLFKIKTKNDNFLSIICYYYSDNSTIMSIQIDLWIKLMWRGIEWINSDYVLDTIIKYKDFYIPCEGCEVAITVFKELVANGIVKEKYHVGLTNKLKKDKDNFCKPLYNLFGEYVYKIYDFICESNYKELNKQQSKIRAKLRGKFPGKYLINSIIRVCKKIHNIFVAKGKLVAFVGPDGSGKTTFIDLSEKHFEKLYNGVKKYHIRFNILPELKTGRGISSMKGQVNKNSEQKVKRSFISKLASWVTVLYYTIDFFIGRVPLRKYRVKNYIVFYDRYYYDFFVQPTSRKLIYKFRKLLLIFVKKPDLIIHLDANAETVYQRKQELSIKEIEMQNNILNELFKDFKNVYTIKTDGKSIAEIDNEIFKVLFKEW